MSKFVFEITVEAPVYPYPENDKWGEDAIAMDWLCQTFQQAQLARHGHIRNHLKYNPTANEECDFVKAQYAAIEQIDEFVKSIKFVRKESSDT